MEQQCQNMNIISSHIWFLTGLDTKNEFWKYFFVQENIGVDMFEYFDFELIWYRMQTSSPRILTKFHPFIPLALNSNKEAATPARTISKISPKTVLVFFFCEKNPVNVISEDFVRKRVECNFPGWLVKAAAHLSRIIWFISTFSAVSEVPGRYLIVDAKVFFYRKQKDKYAKTLSFSLCKPYR